MMVINKVFIKKRKPPFLRVLSQIQVETILKKTGSSYTNEEETKVFIQSELPLPGCPRFVLLPQLHPEAHHL